MAAGKRAPAGEPALLCVASVFLIGQVQTKDREAGVESRAVEEQDDEAIEGLEQAARLLFSLVAPYAMSQSSIALQIR